MDRSLSAPAGTLSVAAALQRRVSTRAFLDRPVDRDQVETLVRLAARAPSGGNLQPWHIRIISGEPMAAFKVLMDQRLVEAPDGEGMLSWFYPAELTSMQLRRRQRNGEILYGALGIDRNDATARRTWNLLNFRFYGAPVGIFLFLDRNATPFQWLDLGIYLQSLLLLMEEAGIATCPQADWAMYGDTVRREMGMGENTMLICGIAIGHADPDHPENFIRTERDDPLDPNASQIP